jgi:hypothetical protein
MLFQIGAALLIIWVLNWLWVIYQIINNVDDWMEHKTSDELLRSFLANTPMEQLGNIEQVSKMNSLCWKAGLAFLIAALVF